MFQRPFLPSLPRMNKLLPASYWNEDVHSLGGLSRRGTERSHVRSGGNAACNGGAQQRRGCAAPERPAPAAAAVRKPARPDPGLRRGHFARPSAMGRCRDHPGDRARAVRFSVSFRSTGPRRLSRNLKKRLALTARVLRDGVERVLPVTQIVPGDVILLSAGNLIPADGIILEAQDFLVSEASMTGESFPVEKRPGVVARRCAACRADKLRLPRRVGAQRHGEGAGGSDRPPNRIRRDRRAAAGTPARNRLRARRSPVRLSAHPRDGGHRPFRADGEPAARPPGNRVAAVRGGLGGRPVARNSCLRSSA